MQIIIISPNNTTHQHWHLTPTKFILISSLIVMSIIASVTLLSKWLGSTTDSMTETPHIAYSLLAPEVDINIEPAADMQAYYAKRLGGLQAEAIRLNALAEKLASMTGLDPQDALLDITIPQGGIENEGEFFAQTDFEFHFEELEDNFDQQLKQLAKLQDYLITEESIEAAIPQGSPIKDGWISSYYGNRVDPFNGKKVFHHGLDFAGNAGSEVHAVADGIVSWTGKRGGYGELVEIDHGNGYVTRYAHNKNLTVNVGDRVNKGQSVALIGSTGRSTGPHVHFEVLRDGKAVNPYKFVKH